MSMRGLTRYVVLSLTAALWTSAAAAQAGVPGTGTIAGQVVDSSSGAPLANAEVFVVAATPAATQGVRSAANGRYTIVGVAAGPHTVRVRLLGYGAGERAVTVRAGETAALDFRLGQRSTQLDQIVVTGTGGVTQRRAVGNVIETVKAADVLAVAPARNVEQLVGQRTPGLIVLPGTGQVGTGAQLRVRSATSLSLSNDPIIYIDGVRMNSQVTGGTTATTRGPVQRGAAVASRLNDVNPEDIESIEILKGPAASTLYGTEASNGVIQIITKKGASGKPRWDFTTRQGTNWLMNPEGRAGMLYGRNTAGQIDSVNLYEHEASLNGPIFHNGRNEGYNLGVRGGTDASRYFLSGSYDNDVGIVAWNWDRKFTGRANVEALMGNTLRLQGNVAYIRDRIRLMQPAIDVDPFSQLVWGTPLTLGTIRRGFSNTPPEEWSTVQSHADNDRTTLSLTGTHNPWPWLTQRLVTGLDVNGENNWLLYPRQATPEFAQLLGSIGLGQKQVFRVNSNILTLDYSANAKYAPWRDVEFTSSVGLQHYRNEISVISAVANTFSASPLTTVSSGTTTTGGEQYEANATVGMFVQQALAWQNRRFLVLALRGDDNSAFGQSFKAAYYPKVSGSWVVSEEPFFRAPGVDNLRLRFAYGAAGTQPGTFDAARLYEAATGYQDQPGLVPFSFGNPALKPERSAELEAGFETQLFGNRADLSYTHYRRDVRDAIVSSPLAPSVGYPRTQVVNIGKVKAWGDELAANVRVLQGPRFGWELGTQLSRNGNRILDLGSVPSISVGGGGQAQHRVGFSLADMFLYKVVSAELDPSAASGFRNALCDGGTGRSGLEQGGAPVPCAEAPRVLWGHTQPTWQAGVNTTLTLFRNLRLYARVDGNGGHIQSNTEIRALHNQGSTLPVIRRDDPEFLVYRSIENDVVGTYEAGFLRLRELSASYSLPGALARRVGANGASVSLAGRNLMMLWTAQDGWGTSRDGLVRVPLGNQHVWDPEIRAVGQLSNGFQTILPPTASVAATVRLSY
jgi:TonB-linked SusC/RagA family outer membrane protein